VAVGDTVEVYTLSETTTPIVAVGLIDYASSRLASREHPLSRDLANRERGATARHPLSSLRRVRRRQTPAVTACAWQ